MTGLIRISVVVPVYNCAECLEWLYEQLSTVLNRIAVWYEIILVEDAGMDDSWRVIEELATQDDSVKGYRLAKNFGQLGAIKAGLSKARGDWVVVMDCDLQDPPDYLHEFHKLILCGHDAVFCLYKHRSHSAWRLLLSSIYNGFLRLVTSDRLANRCGNYSIVSRGVLTRFLNLEHFGSIYYSYISTLTLNPGLIDFEKAPRPFGCSAYTFRRLTKHATLTLSAFWPQWLLRVTLPLFAASVLCTAVLLSYPGDALRILDGVLFVLALVCLIYSLTLRRICRARDRRPFEIKNSTEQGRNRQDYKHITNKNFDSYPISM